MSVDLTYIERLGGNGSRQKLACQKTDETPSQMIEAAYPRSCLLETATIFSEQTVCGNVEGQRLHVLRVSDCWRNSLYSIRGFWL